MSRFLLVILDVWTSLIFWVDTDTILRGETPFAPFSCHYSEKRQTASDREKNKKLG